MIYQGMVICLTKAKAIVTTDDFQCFYIKRTPTTYVGKEIEFTENEIINRRPLLTNLMLSAACLAVIFFIASISNYFGLINLRSVFFEPQVFAYVSVDINPSVEIGIDDNGNVLRLDPLNEDAKNLVKNLNLLKSNVSEAIDVLIVEAGRNNPAIKIDYNYVLVSSTLNSQKNKSDKEYQTENKKLDNLMSSIKYNIQNKKNGKVNVFLVQTDMNERNNARNEGISTGRYILYNKCKSSGNSLSIEEARKIPVNDLINNVVISAPVTPITPTIPSKTGQSTPVPPSKQVSHNKSTPTKDANKKLNTPLSHLQTVPFVVPSPISSPTPQTKNTNFFRFESFNYKGYYMRHDSFKGHLSSYVTPEDDSIFKVVPGLADKDCISFESKNIPGFFLTVQDFKIVLKNNDGSNNFNECATFRKVAGFAGKNTVSFQSYNYPNRYIRHCEFLLQIDEISKDLEKKDASYIEIKID